MDNLLDAALQDGVSLAILIMVLAGLYRLTSRILGIIEIGIDRFLLDFARIADGISDIADSNQNCRN